MAKKKKNKADAQQTPTALIPLQENKTVALPLNEEEKLRVQQWKEKNKKISNTPKLIASKDQEGKPDIKIDRSKRGSEIDQINLINGNLCTTTGTKDGKLAVYFIDGCVKACGFNTDDFDKYAEKFNLIAKELNALKPQDEFEGMLICRLVALHFQIMEFMTRSMLNNQIPEFIDLNVNRTTKLSRIYNETLETLMRYRRRGEQRFIVQHVNVNDGGQAMVGNFQAGRGGKQENREVSP